jgi:hypothetical protein
VKVPGWVGAREPNGALPPSGLTLDALSRSIGLGRQGLCNWYLRSGCRRHGRDPGRLRAALGQRSDLVDHLLGVERLVHEVVRTRGSGARLIVGLRLVGENHHEGRRRGALDLTAQVVAVRSFERRVNQRDLWMLGLRFRERVRGVSSDHGFEAFPGEGDLDHLAHGLAVVDGQQSGGHASSR